MRKRSKKYSGPKPQKVLLFPELKAAQLLEQGKTQQALQVAVRALAEGRRNPDLSNIAGVCAAAMGDETLAAQLWQHAIEISPDYAQAWFNLGLWHENQQQSAQAADCYQQVIALQPDNIDTMLRLSNLLIVQQQLEEAESLLSKVLEAVPQHPQADNNLGLVLASRRQFGQAEQHYRRAIANDPADIAASINLGVLLAATEREQEAEQHYLKALETEPDNAKALTNYGLLLEKLKRLPEAEIRHRAALESQPDSVEILSNLANVLSAQRQEAEAEARFYQALSINPDSAATHTNLGVLLANLKRDDEAEQHFREALRLKPDYLLPQLNLSYLQLSQGRFAEGWVNYETRYHPGLPDNGIPLPSITAPQWHGENLDGKSLLIWTEQGYGDQIQFARYIAILKQRWQVNITLVCRAALVTLFAALDGVDQLLGAGQDLVLPEHIDYWALPLSMPLLLGTQDIQDIPATIPYLSALAERVAHWRALLDKPGFKVGLVWQGNPRHHNDRWRSLAGPEELLPLLEIPGVHFYSLQKGWEPSNSPTFFQHAAVTHLGNALEDFADTAAIVAQLDLVICVDTAIAHLAGALGKPCWLMLPHYRTDWRWLQQRTDTPWYPGVLSLFRQGEDESWAPVIQQIKHQLQTKITAG